MSMWGIFYDKNNKTVNEGLVVLHADDPKVGSLHLILGYYTSEEAVWYRYHDLLSDWRMGLYSYC